MAELQLKYLIDVSAGAAQRKLESLDKEFKKLESRGDAAGGLGGVSSAFGTLSSFAGPAAIAVGAAATAITAVTAAASVAATTIFELARSAAAWGSQVSDIHDKTGLAAESIIAFDLAAKQSGTSLEIVIKAIQKFSKFVGEADRGSKEAAATLKKFGITTSEAMGDLDGALEKVFKGLLNARSGVEQMALAQQVFGKSGAELLPFIKSFNGDLSALKRQAAELGLTFNNQTAAAMDKLDDQLQVLSMQFAGLKTQLGIEFIPIVTDLVTATSNFVKNNGPQIRSLFTDLGDVVRGTIIVVKRFGETLDGIASNTRVPDYFLGLMMIFNPLGYVINRTEMALLNFLRTLGAAERAKEPLAAMAQGVVDLTGTLDDQSDAMKTIEEQLQRLPAKYAVFKSQLDAMRATGQISEAAALEADLQFQERMLQKRKALLQQQLAAVRGNADEERRVRQQLFQVNLEIEKQTNEAIQRRAELTKRLNDQTLQNIRQQMQAQIELNNLQVKTVQAQLDLLLARNKVALESGRISPETEIGARLQLSVDFMQQQFEAEERLRAARLESLNQQLEAARGNAAEEKRLKGEIALIQIEAEKAIYDLALKRGELEQKLADEFIELMRKRGEALRQELLGPMAGAVQLVNLDLGAAALENNQLAGPQPPSPDPWYEFRSAVLDALDIELYQDRAAAIAQIFGGLGDMLGHTIEGLINGVGDLVQAWVLYGDVGPQAVRKMLASVLAALAQEAAVKALFQLAEGFAALFFNPGEAALHFKAAALYGAVAATAAIAGRAVAGNAFQTQGAGTGGGRGGSSGRSAGSSSASPAALSRQTPNAYISGRDPGVAQLAVSVQTLADKISSMRPSDVVIAASREKRGLIGRMAVEDVKSNSAIGTDLLRRSGAR